MKTNNNYYDFLVDKLYELHYEYCCREFGREGTSTERLRYLGLVYTTIDDGALYDSPIELSYDVENQQLVCTIEVDYYRDGGTSVCKKFTATENVSIESMVEYLECCSFDDFYVDALDMFYPMVGSLNEIDAV